MIQDNGNVEDNPQNLARGFEVGNTLSNYHWYGNGNVSFSRSVMFYQMNLYSSPGTYNRNSAYGPRDDFALGDENFIGFRFLGSTGGLHYGWAQLEIGRNYVTVTRWAYESDPNTAIEIQPIPEPTGLGLLGLGASLGVGAAGWGATAHCHCAHWGGRTRKT